MSRRRRIVVNTAIYRHGTSGTATATAALVEALESLPDVEVLQASPPPRSRPSVLNAVRDARWDMWRASRTYDDVDLLVSPCNVGRRGRARKHLLVVHDVMVYDHPELFDRKFAAYFRAVLPPSLRSADRVLTLSEHARRAIRRQAPGADVRVVSWAHGGHGRPVRATWPDRPVVLMVGATEPIKNQLAGIRAVASLRRTTGVDVGLRLIGPAGRDEAAVRQLLVDVDPDRRWAIREGDVPGPVLDAAYASSWLLLQPSHDEGFGLPLVEAARYGLPSVHSGRGAMPFVMPQVDAGGVSADALAAAMVPLLERSRWVGAAAVAAERARAFEPEAFRATVRAEVADLLPAVS